jgi:hypothetical protein
MGGVADPGIQHPRVIYGMRLQGLPNEAGRGMRGVFSPDGRAPLLIRLDQTFAGDDYIAGQTARPSLSKRCLAFAHVGGFAAE